MRQLFNTIIKIYTLTGLQEIRWLVSVSLTSFHNFPRKAGTLAPISTTERMINSVKYLTLCMKTTIQVFIDIFRNVQCYTQEYNTQIAILIINSHTVKVIVHTDANSQFLLCIALSLHHTLTHKQEQSANIRTNQLRSNNKI